MSISRWRTGSRIAALTAGAALLSVGATSWVLAGQDRREFQVVARKYTYRVSGTNAAEIKVSQNDLVRITFSTEDIPHSFTVEDTANSHYGIMRRADPGKPVSFEFRADSPGSFRFHCSLTLDDGCKKMVGTLIVEPRTP